MLGKWDSAPHRFLATRPVRRSGRFFRAKFHFFTLSMNDLPPNPNDLPVERRRKTGHISQSMRDAVRIPAPKACGTPHTECCGIPPFFSETRPSTGGGAEQAQHRPQNTHAPFHWPRTHTTSSTSWLPLRHCSSIEPSRYCRTRTVLGR